SPRSVSAVQYDTETMYPPKNIPPTMPACALLSDHSSRSCGSSAANVENPSIEQTCAAIRIGTVRMGSYDTIRNPPCQLDWHELRIACHQICAITGCVTAGLFRSRSAR